MVLWVHTARADGINLTGAETSSNIAEITVMDDHVRVVLEAFVGNLEVFEDLVPDDGVSELGVERPDIASRMKHFSGQVLQIITAAARSCRLKWCEWNRVSVSIASHPLPA